MPSGDTSFDACIASARPSFLILRWQRVLFDQSTLARMILTRRSSQESLFRRWMPVVARTHHTVLATDPICPTIPNYASGTDIRYGSTHLYYKMDVTLQGGRCPADQPSNVTAVGRPHVSTPEAFSKAATPIYIFIINNSKIALFCYVSIFRFGLFWEV